MDLSFLDKVSILVVGDLMLDRYLIGQADRMSGEAPVPIVRITEERFSAGGAANVAANLLSLGVKTKVFGKCGIDENGGRLRQLLSIDNEFQGHFSAAPTIVKTRIVSHKQQMIRFDEEANPQKYSVEAQLAWLALEAAKYDAVIISDYSKGVVTQGLIECLREVRTEHGIFLAMDPKPRRKLDVFGMDLLTPNLEEAIQLIGAGPTSDHYGQKSYVADAVLDRYKPKHLLMTLGGDGMLLGGTHRGYRSADANTLVDVTGAGDTVIAVMTAALVGGLDPIAAMELASKAAGIVVSRFGTATVTRAELSS